MSERPNPHVSKRWGRTALQLQKFSISVVNTDFLIFPHEFSNIAIHLSALQAILWYLQHLYSIWHLSQHFTEEKTHWWIPSFHCLLMFNFRYLILNFQNIFRTVQLHLAFPAAEHTPFLHICLVGLEQCLGTSGLTCSASQWSFKGWMEEAILSALLSPLHNTLHGFCRCSYQGWTSSMTEIRLSRCVPLHQIDSSTPRVRTTLLHPYYK